MTNRLFALKKLVKDSTRKRQGRRENEVQAGVLAYLETRGDFWFWRANTGAVRYGDAFVKFGKRGAPDIQGIWAPTGRFVGIECKREVGGELSVFQERWADNCVAFGGLYVVARSVEDVARAMGPVLLHVVQVPMRQRVVRR